MLIGNIEYSIWPHNEYYKYTEMVNTLLYLKHFDLSSLRENLGF